MRKGNPIKIYVEPEEAFAIKEYADCCGLSVSALCRLVVTGYAPKPMPKKEFWGIIDGLYDIHDSLEKGSKTTTELEKLILSLQEFCLIPERSGFNGGDKSMAD